MRSLIVLALLAALSGSAGAAGRNGAVFVKETAPPSTLAAGQTFKVSITLRNSGETAWTKADGFKLGAQSPADNSRWRAGRVPLSEGSVKPGGTHTFTFTITAPTEAGTYAFQWRMAQEKKEWFGQPSPIHKVFVKPERSLYGFTMGFEVQGETGWAQPPLFSPFDRRDPRWWDEMLDEASLAGADFIAPVTRGCNACKGGDAGNSCPRDLNKLVAALEKRPAAGRPKVALFVDTGGAFAGHKNACKHGQMSHVPPIDLGDATGAGEGGQQAFWDMDMKIFYDVVPREHLFMVGGRPVIYFWSVAEDLGYANHKGNSSKFLAWIRARVKERLGVEPFVVLDQSWVAKDPSITPAIAEGVNDWFDPKINGCTVREWGGRRFAVSVPGFIDPPGGPPKDRRVLPRAGGKTLSACLDKIRGAGTTLTLLEGLTDAVESAGYYRSKAPDWSTPDQYLDLVRAGLRQR